MCRKSYQHELRPWPTEPAFPPYWAPTGEWDDPRGAWALVGCRNVTDPGNPGASADVPTTAAPSQPVRRKRRWRRRVLWGFLSIFGVVLLLAGAEFGYLAYENGKIKKIPVPGIQKTPTQGATANQENILLLGSTTRCGLKVQSAAFGYCGAPPAGSNAAGYITGVNSDVVMVLHLDPNHHRVAILSIPRDLVLQNARPGQFHKVDAALADGPGALVNVVEQDLGIPINHFVELNFDTFQSVVGALGGLHMYFPVPVKDPASSLNIRTAGCIDLTPFQALALVRARNLFYEVNGQWHADGTGDLGRIIRVHEFLRVIADAVAKRGIGNLFTDNGLIGAVAPNLTVDSGFSTGEMVHLVRTFHSLNASTVPEMTVPIIEDGNVAGYTYQGINFGSVVFPTYPADLTVVQQLLGRAKPPGWAVPPSSVKVSVVDGTEGNPNAATTTAAELGALGYHVVGTGTSTPVGQIAETIVYYAKGKVPSAERVVQSLSGIVSMARGPTTDGAAVTVGTGSDFSVARPVRASVPSATTVRPGKAPVTTTETTSTPRTSTRRTSTPRTSTPSTTTQPGFLDQPTAPTGSLTSWDPHACAPTPGASG